MATEVQRLSGQRQISKTTTINGKSEQHTLQQVDFNKELAVFVNADINRPAWLDQYQIDSLFNTSGQLNGLVYTSKNEDLKTKRFEIALEGARVSKIMIKNISESLIAHVEQDLVYEPAKGYSISSFQRLIFFPESNIDVKVVF